MTDSERRSKMEEKVAKEYRHEKRKYQNSKDRDMANCLQIELAAYRILKETKK